MAENVGPGGERAMGTQAQLAKRLLRPRSRHRPVPGGGLLAAACALWLVLGLWGPGVPPGIDTLAHLVRTEIGLQEIFSRGHVNGWAPGTGVGSEIFLFYGPGLALLTGALRIVCLGLLSTAGAFKVLLFLSFVILPLAVASMARAFGLSRRAAALAAVLSLAVSSTYGPGIEGTFASGLVPVQVAAPFMVFALGQAVRLWLTPRPGLIARLAAAVAAVVVIHPISAVILAALGATTIVLLAVERATVDRLEATAARRRPFQPALPGLERFGLPPPERTRDAIVLSVAAAAVSAALAAFWLLPFLAHRDLRGALSGWITPGFATRIHEILDGKVLFRTHVVLFIVAAMIVALLVEPERRGRLALVLAPLVYLFIAHEIQRRYPFNEIAFQLPNRGLGYAGLVAVLPLALVLDRLARPLVRALGRPAEALLLLVAVAVAVWPMTPLRKAADDDVAEPVMAAAARELRRLVPEHARFVTERQPAEGEATNVTGPPFWLALASGRNVVNAFAPETTTAPEPMFVGDSMTTQEPEQAADRLARAGVTHVVTTSERGAAHFEGSPRFVRLWSSAPIAIFAVRPAPDRPEPSTQVSTDGPAGAEIVDLGNERLHVYVSARAPVTATLAVAWSPKWSARLDGRPVRLERASDGLLVVRVTPGTHDLRLAFGRDLWDRLGALVSAATLAGGGWLLLRRRRAPSVRPAPLRMGRLAGRTGRRAPVERDDAAIVEPS